LQEKSASIALLLDDNGVKEEELSLTYMAEHYSLSLALSLWLRWKTILILRSVVSQVVGLL
jgi:hypothetical protein